MKKIFFIPFLVLLVLIGSCDKEIPLTEEEAAAGLKEALKVGTEKSVVIAHTVDGYFLSKIKIPFPQDAHAAELIMKDYFQTDYENFVKKMNRAAEDAADDAQGIFLNAIAEMTIVDALNILNGANDAATQYLRAKSYDSLNVRFKPDIEDALNNIGATQSWELLMNNYNALPSYITNGNEVNTDLPAYTTEKALDGLFVYVADEELKIRTDANARITDLLKKVFGK